AGPDRQVLDIDLDGLPRHAELAPAPRAGTVPLQGDLRHVVFLEDTIDGRRGDVDMVVSLQEEAQALHSIVPLPSGSEDERFNMGGDAIRTQPRAALELPQPARPVLPVPALPEIELARGDAEESAGQAGIMRNLLVVLDDSEADFGRSGLLGFSGCSAHLGCPFSGWRDHVPAVQDSP